MAKITQRITPCLWFDSQAEEAAKFYTSIFKNSKIDGMTHYDEESSKAAGRPKGSVLTVDFQLEGQSFIFPDLVTKLASQGKHFFQPGGRRRNISSGISEACQGGQNGGDPRQVAQLPAQSKTFPGIGRGTFQIRIIDRQPVDGARLTHLVS